MKLIFETLDKIWQSDFTLYIFKKFFDQSELSEFLTTNKQFKWTKSSLKCQPDPYVFYL